MGFAETIFQSALQCGYDNCGIIAPEDLTGSEELLKERMEKILLEIKKIWDHYTLEVLEL